MLTLINPLSETLRCKLLIKLPHHWLILPACLHFKPHPNHAQSLKKHWNAQHSALHLQFLWLISQCTFCDHIMGFKLLLFRVRTCYVFFLFLLDSTPITCYTLPTMSESRFPEFDTDLTLVHLNCQLYRCWLIYSTEIIVYISFFAFLAINTVE